METTFTRMQVIDLLLSDLPQDTFSALASRQTIHTPGVHFKLNFFIS